MLLKNRIAEFEKDICVILSQVSHHIHPEIIQKIQLRNHEEIGYFTSLFDDKINISNYLFSGSACVFPGEPYPSASGGTKCCSPEGNFMLEQITNIAALGARNDRLSALLDRVPTALRR
jgi:hypothetical protein